MKLRKFIIRQFALNYTIKLFNRYWTALRVSRYIMPCFIITGLSFVYNDSNWNAFSVFFGLLTLIFLFFGFLYFEFYPIKQNEYNLLDEDQKRQWDFYYQKEDE